jgi:hypothetical protein
MKIAGVFSFNGGTERVQKKYPQHLREIERAITSIDASICKTKKSKEKTMKGELLYSPPVLNKCFKVSFKESKWQPVRVGCDYPLEFYLPNYKPRPLRRGAFREMDFVKDKLGVEVQFGKYAFMVYNVAAKMTIFKNLGHIDTGVEIVPVKAFADEMSSGVSYFEQFVWDLQKRGVSNIDTPVMIIGIDK